MSDSQFILDPPPIDYGSMSLADADKDFGMDCTAAMQLRATNILSVTLGSINRDDGDPLDSGDIAITNIDIVNGGLQFGWTITANGNCLVYYIVFVLTLTNGTVIQRTIMIEVKPYVG